MSLKQENRHCYLNNSHQIFRVGKERMNLIYVEILLNLVYFSIRYRICHAILGQPSYGPNPSEDLGIHVIMRSEKLLT